jgi:hypothetical protein
VHEEILKIQIDEDVGSCYYLNSKVAAFIIKGNLKYKGARLTVKQFIKIMIGHNQQASMR